MFLKNTNFLKNKSSFFYSVLTLFTGTVIAQAIPVALSPLITRLYSPADFGSLSLIIGISSIIAGVASGKYEMAIMIPSRKIEGIKVAYIACLLALITSVVVLAGILIIYHQKLGYFNVTPDLLFYLPINIFLLSLINILNYWYGRNKKYLKISKGKIGQSLSSGLSQLGFGVAKTADGLIKATIIGQALFLVIIGKSFFLNLWRWKKHFYYKNLIIEFKKYKSFLLFYAPTTLLDNASLQAPVLIITHYYSLASTGLFGLAFRMISLPSVLIGTAISQVYLQKLAELKNNETALRPYIMQVLKKLFLLSIVPTLILLLLGEFLFSLVFGQEWRVSGQIAQILAIPYAIRFIASPLSPALIVNKKFKVQALWQFSYFVVTFLALYLGSSYSLITLIYFYACSETLLYLTYLFLIVKYSK